MKTTHYLTATVQKGNYLEINLPELSEGQNVEIILIVPDNNTMDKSNDCFSDLCSSEQDRFSKKSLAERRKLMTQQAEIMVKYYEQDKSWREWESLDVGHIYDY